MGYNIFDLIWSAIKSEDKKSDDDDGNEVVFNESVRFYDSMQEMLEIEKLNILYPEELPKGYEFNNFEADDTGKHLVISAFGTDSMIDFKIVIDTGIEIYDYAYEANGVKYNIADMGDGLCQAFWRDGQDYYMIVVDDESILSEIIENLRRFEST
jgi:hypothetical protein